MAKEILLKNGITILVDDEDYERVNQYKWSSFNKKQKFHVYCAQHKSLTKFILGLTGNERVMRANGDCHDFRKSNLRVITLRDVMVLAESRTNSTSIYKGVYWEKSRKRWRAEIKVHGVQKHLGTFHDEEEAAKAYNEAAKMYFGHGAYLNQLEA